MTETENVVLEQLRLIRSEIGAVRTAVADLQTDMIEVKQRLGFIENQYANLSGRVDRIAGDVALIKRRLELTEA